MMRKFFQTSRDKAELSAEEGEQGLFLFSEVNEAIKAERVLKRAKYGAALVAPPMHLRAGCDLAVALPRVESPGAQRELATKDVDVRDWADTLDGSVELVDLVTSKDFGDWLMVRAGNMKITVEKATGLIVNTSGGGCPDIPYLNIELVGHTLDTVPRPADLAYTLCGVMLDRAYCEARLLLKDLPEELCPAGTLSDGEADS